MKNKGFTLVELLAVIVVLAIISIIAVPNVMNALNSSKGALSNFEKRSIEDASKRLILEVINCDISTEAVNILKLANSNIDKSNKCSKNQEYIIGHTLNNITINALKVNGYIDDVKSRCSGTISITTDKNYKITVDTSNVKCES